MKIKYITFALVLFMGCISVLSRSANPPMVKWKVKNPFEQKVFIENKGQYQIKDNVKTEDILFGARQNGLQYYFTTNSIWIEHDVIENDKTQQQEESNNEESKEDEELHPSVPQFHEMKFIDANTKTEITTEDEVSWYYNFATVDNLPIKARAWKKLTYKNLYPGIDMEFYFPEDKQGFEYTFIVHPGADPSQIQIQYPQQEEVKYTSNGNIKIQSAYGEFIDHAPIAIESGSKNAVACSFNNNKAGIIGFNVSNYKSNNDSLIIDPWTTTPTFIGTNNAFDLDWDYAGNCYIYGGSNPFQVIKYDNSGTLLWSFTENFYITDNSANYYGSISVNKNSQSVYMTEGLGYYTGGRIIKLNSSGTYVKLGGGNPNFRELWAVSVDPCSGQLIVVGGGTSGIGGPPYTNTGGLLDTGLITFTAYNMLNWSGCCDDFWDVAFDNSGNHIYAATVTTGSNILYKFDVPSFSEDWYAPDNYSMQETGFYGAEDVYNSSHGNYNGLATNDSALYTWDSHILEKWSTANGNLIGSDTINGTSNSTINSGGLTVDACDNIFVGNGPNIEQYNNLTYENTITGSDTIYDIKLGSNNVLYACGQNFVEAIQPSISPCVPIIAKNQIINSNCVDSLGSVIISPSGAIAPYSISWNTIPVQTGTTLSNVSPGTYIATIEDASCPPFIAYDTIQILNLVIKDTVTVNNPTLCNGDSVVLSAAGASIYTWSPGIGLSATTGDSVIANPNTSTTYTVIGTSLTKCPDTSKSIVTVVYGLIKPILSDSGDILTSSATQGNQWLRNDTVLAGATNQTYKVTISGWYQVVATNLANGCSTTSDSLYVTPTGINQLSINSNQISIYPNPTGGEIFINISSSVEEVKDWSLQITDVLGRIVYVKGSLNYSNQIDLSHLPAAVYFITVMSNTGRAVVPIVRQ